MARTVTAGGPVTRFMHHPPNPICITLYIRMYTCNTE